jgi:hypothetical protein
VDAAASGVTSDGRAGWRKARERFANTQTTDVVSYGKTVWSWHPLLMLNLRRSFALNRAQKDRQFADDGDKKEFVAEESTA